jgi:hypothetical protein
MATITNEQTLTSTQQQHASAFDFVNERLLGIEQQLDDMPLLIDSVEAKLDEITRVIAIAPKAPTGSMTIDQQGHVGINVSSPTEMLHVVGKIRSTDRILAENGHGQFVDAPSMTLGSQNLRNGVARFYCIDTSNHIEIEAPDDIAANRKQYLQDKQGKIPVEETDGYINVSTGLKVNGVQVVTAQQASVGVPSSGLATPTNNGWGFNSEIEMQDYLDFIEDLRVAVQEIASRLQVHGLIAS